MARRIRERALFLDVERACLRAFALLARAVARSDDEETATPLSSDRLRLAATVDRALDGLLEEEASEVLRDAAAGGRRHARSRTALHEIAIPLGLEPETLRVACAHFHALDAAVREAFFQLLVEGRSLDALAPEHGDPMLLAQRARRALDVLRHSVPPNIPCSDPTS